MGRPRVARALALLPFLVLAAAGARAQHVRGELLVEARDPQGGAVPAAAELVCNATQFRRNLRLGADGRYAFQDLAFGVYRLTLRAPGLASWSNLIEVRSEVPVKAAVQLGVAPLLTQVEVGDSATLIDPYRAGVAYFIGEQALAESLPTQPGRGLTDLVSDLPGLVYEANGVLHPRGSEYALQYVVDGLPITQNRSPAFAPSPDGDLVASMRVLTAGFPAEYGRKLGAVVEVTTEKNLVSGFHGQVDAGGGPFGTWNGAARASWAGPRDRFRVGGDGFHTGRYLDSPVLENYTNRATAAGASAQYEHDFSDRDRLRVSVTHKVVRYLVPNEMVQQQAGQRQDAKRRESGAGVDFRRILSPELLLSLSGAFREAAATLSSNELATPVVVAQDRGYREGYLRGDLSGHHRRHDWKVGIDGALNPVREALQYHITDATQFDPDTRPRSRFSDRRTDHEASAFAQDRIHLANWNFSLGLRFDRYDFVVRRSAWSPRLGASRYLPGPNLLLHASYDRVFQTPALENLLLASSPQVESLSSVVARLPVEPAGADYFEVGFTKGLVGKLRLDFNVFRRDFHNYSDDDILLDTGVSFPTAFDRARITGEELRLEVPRWGRFSGYLSYANQVGTARGPIRGGLFLGSEAGGIGDSRRFPVSQDQRNTVRARVRLQAAELLWLTVAARYGSGLPAEKVGDANPAFLLAQYGPAILSQVNLEAERVRRNFSLDLAAGWDVCRKGQRSVSLHVQGTNLTDRVNVINFASVFSGTALAPPRSVSLRARLTF